MSAMQASVHRYDAADASGAVILDNGVVLPFTSDALRDSGLRGLRVGQRLSMEVTDGDPPTVTRLWIVGIGEGQSIG